MSPLPTPLATPKAAHGAGALLWYSSHKHREDDAKTSSEVFFRTIGNTHEDDILPHGSYLGDTSSGSLLVADRDAASPQSQVPCTSYTVQSSTAGPGVFHCHLWEFYCSLEMNKTRAASKVLEHSPKQEALGTSGVKYEALITIGSSPDGSVQAVSISCQYHQPPQMKSWLHEEVRQNCWGKETQLFLSWIHLPFFIAIPVSQWLLPWRGKHSDAVPGIFSKGWGYLLSGFHSDLWL